jgi:hypothetical protein
MTYVPTLLSRGLVKPVVCVLTVALAKFEPLSEF